MAPRCAGAAVAVVAVVAEVAEATAGKTIGENVAMNGAEIGN